MSDLEIVMGVALCVLLWAWRRASTLADTHYRAACVFREGIRRIAIKEASVSYDEEEDEITIRTEDGTATI